VRNDVFGRGSAHLEPTEHFQVFASDPGIFLLIVRRTDPMTQSNNNVSLPSPKHASHVHSPYLKLFRVQP